jgi:hypothetical protein
MSWRAFQHYAVQRSETMSLLHHTRTPRSTGDSPRIHKSKKPKCQLTCLCVKVHRSMPNFGSILASLDGERQVEQTYSISQNTRMAVIKHDNGACGPAYGKPDAIGNAVWPDRDLTAKAESRLPCCIRGRLSHAQRPTRKVILILYLWG